MSTAKNIVLAITIILFLIGAWPIAILTATVFVTLSIVNGIQTKKQLQELKEENQQLRQDLERAQAVQRAMDQAEKKD